MSANNTTSVSSSTVTVYSWETILSGLYCLTVGLVGILVNSVIIVVIWKSKKLHTPCFAVLIAQSVCSWLMATGYINDGVQRLGIFFNVLGVTYPRLICYVMYIPKTIAIPPSAIFTCVVGLDRLYCITFPTQYKKHARKFVEGALIFGACVAIGNVLAAGLTAPSPIDGTIMCFNFFAAFHPTFTKYFTNHNLAFCILSVCIYASIVFIVRCRHLKSDASNDRFLQSQLSILPMIQAIMVAYLICGVCPEIMASVAPVIQNGIYQPKIVLYSSMLKVTSVCTDFFILLSKSKEFRNTLKRILGVGSVVVSIPAQPTSTAAARRSSHKTVPVS